MGATATKPLLVGIVLYMRPINVKSSPGIGAFIGWTDR